jgi:hypothetical protein
MQDMQNAAQRDAAPGHLVHQQMTAMLERMNPMGYDEQSASERRTRATIMG